MRSHHRCLPNLAWLGTALAGLWLFALAAALQLVPAAAPSAAAEDKVDVKVLYEKKACAYCHGADGRTPRFDTIPIIAGQMPRYSYLVMLAYKSGERQGVGANQHSDVNDLVSDEQMKLLADYIATLK